MFVILCMHDDMQSQLMTQFRFEAKISFERSFKFERGSYDQDRIQNAKDSLKGYHTTYCMISHWPFTKDGRRRRT